MHGGKLDLDGAAGVGRLDLVLSLFNEDRSLKSNATKTQWNPGSSGLASMAEQI